MALDHGGPDSFKPPDDGSRDGDGCHEVFDIAVEAGGYPSPVFEAAEHALHDIALPIDCRITFVVNFAIAFVRNDGLSAPFGEPITQIVAAITFVADQLG